MTNKQNHKGNATFQCYLTVECNNTHHTGNIIFVDATTTNENYGDIFRISN